MCCRFDSHSCSYCVVHSATILVWQEWQIFGEPKLFAMISVSRSIEINSRGVFPCPSRCKCTGIAMFIRSFPATYYVLQWDYSLVLLHWQVELKAL